MRLREMYLSSVTDSGVISPVVFVLSAEDSDEPMFCISENGVSYCVSVDSQTENAVLDNAIDMLSVFEQRPLDLFWFYDSEWSGNKVYPRRSYDPLPNSVFLTPGMKLQDL